MHNAAVLSVVMPSLITLSVNLADMHTVAMLNVMMKECCFKAHSAEC